MRPHFLLPALGLVLLGACSSVSEFRVPAGSVPLARAVESMRSARKMTLPEEERAAAYVEAAALSAPLLTPAQSPARDIYNAAAAELTELLLEQDDGRLWNRPLTLPGPTPYRLRLRPGVRDTVWSPTQFTKFQLARKVPHQRLRANFADDGVGGTLVGIQEGGGSDEARRARFEQPGGFAAPVTATLDFRGREVALTLHDPARPHPATVNGKSFPLAADLSAPLASRPVRNELLYGLLGMVRVEKYLSDTGLYLLQPYDPDRIPVILIHGLLSTPQMWTNIANELEADPALRGRFQFAVFMYPTGNPVIYSALRCREAIGSFHRQHPGAGVVLVGHSMGGLLARLQVTEPGRAIWDAQLKRHADALYASVPADSVVRRSMLFHADPQVQRVVFICTPHRGSGLALGGLGTLAIRLITLPTTLVTEFTRTLGDALEFVGGKPQIPTSINSLSPKSPTLLALDQLPILAPHHSIIGDRGRGDTPNSSDGVVPYWSSHLASAESELIVPGPHGSHELPQTVAEVKRILRLHLARSGRAP